MRSASQGGWAVIESLRAVGLDEAAIPERVALAESQLSFLKSFRTVLFQNAWTSIPRRELRELMVGEPLRRRARESIRRSAALTNALRAERLIAMTDYMGELVRGRTGRQSTTVRVGTSLDLFDVQGVEPPDSEGWGDYVLVPGSVQAYKRPELALSYLASSHLRAEVSAVVFAGLRPSPTVERQVRVAAQNIGVSVVFTTLTRPQVKWAYQHSVMTILPSRLESLGFGLGEALYFAPYVVASPIPAHVEVADFLGASPIWIERGEDQSFLRPSLDEARLREGWARLAEILLESSR